MFRLKLYYHAKPFLPWSLRITIRRFFALRKLATHKDIWPINISAGEKPNDWAGWPDNKRFAFVLSHDVESQFGYDKIEPLIELEETLGFRSSINFIPEGQYSVSDDLIQDLKKRGFEVGVHGLHHDGKLYNRYKTFSKRAKRINHYIEKWGAAGFRSPLMHHRLDWIHDLNIIYDSSTFDTDPFEPQPDGINTIFPFWVNNPNSNSKSTPASKKRAATSSPDSNSLPSTTNLHISKGGYVELPYTLSQDSTLFLLLREKSNRIWKEKLSWIADKSGMAFLNIHPDYIDFEGNGTNYTYPISLYSEFLEHVKSEYADQYWHTTPIEIAKHFIQNKNINAKRL